MASVPCACRSLWLEPHDPTGRKWGFFVRSSLACVWEQFLFPSQHSAGQWNKLYDTSAPRSPAYVGCDVRRLQHRVRRVPHTVLARVWMAGNNPIVWPCEQRDHTDAQPDADLLLLILWRMVDLGGANGIRPHPLLLVAGGGFWLVRTALQPLLFRLRRDLSTMLTLLFITGAVLHLLIAIP